MDRESLVQAPIRRARAKQAGCSKNGKNRTKNPTRLSKQAMTGGMGMDLEPNWMKANSLSVAAEVGLRTSNVLHRARAVQEAADEDADEGVVEVEAPSQMELIDDLAKVYGEEHHIAIVEMKMETLGEDVVVAVVVREVLVVAEAAVAEEAGARAEAEVLSPRSNPS